jgi:SAM-dependent methyltransferase
MDSGDYFRCPGCGLVFVGTVQSGEKLYRSYDGGFWKSLRRKIFMPFRSFTGARHFRRSTERAGGIFGLVLSHAALGNAKPAFLDIGCNKGFLLAAAISHSWDAWGVELVPELTIPFKKEFPACAGNIFSQGFSQAQEKIRDGMFDAVSAIDVIEHFEDPRRDMGNIFRILRPGGILVVQTPDTEAPLAKTLGGNWGALKPLEHLHLFNRKNLAVFAGEIGFKKIEFFEAFDTEDGNLVAVLGK